MEKYLLAVIHYNVKTLYTVSNKNIEEILENSKKIRKFIRMFCRAYNFCDYHSIFIYLSPFKSMKLVLFCFPL